MSTAADIRMSRSALFIVSTVGGRIFMQPAAFVRPNGEPDRSTPHHAPRAALAGAEARHAAARKPQ